MKEGFVGLPIEGLWRERDSVTRFQRLQKRKTLDVIHTEIALKFGLGSNVPVPLQSNIAANDLSELFE